MPAHGTLPDEVLQLLTRAGGTWWLAIAVERPLPEETTVELADIPPLEVPRDGTFWDFPDAGEVMPLATTVLPAATGDTTAAAWCLFNDEACTDLALSRWFAEDRVVATGVELSLIPEVLTIEFTPNDYPFGS